jgi:hypothetical protein
MPKGDLPAGLQATAVYTLGFTGKPDLSNAKGDLLARCLLSVLEIDKDALCSLGAKVRR